MWCPSCRDEFRAGVTHCVDCEVALVAARPPDPVRESRPEHRPRPQPPDDVLVEYDLAEWPDIERAALDLRLHMAEIPAQWEGDGVLVTSRVFRAEVEELIDFVDDVERDAAAAGTVASDGRSDGSDPLAGPGRRILGALADSVVFSIVLVPVRLSHPSFGAGIVIAAILACLYNVIPVALTGRTPGKVLVRTRVRRVDGAMPPGWGVATVRWLVPALGVLLWPLGAVGRWVNFAWTLAIYLPIFGIRRQGLHDRAAHTVVTLERSRRA
jgi:hypothetical protein